MLDQVLRLGMAAACVLVAAASAAQEKDGPAKLDKQRCPKPSELAIIFSNGYAGDLMPKEDERFEALLQMVKEAGFNVIHCTYTDKRLELCKKHGVKMMVDLLAEQHHVYKSPGKAEAVCVKLRGNADVWGYNIWNDPFGKAGEGRRRDINNVRQWDPTHPAFCGTYRAGGIKYLANADVAGYYDFHWKRGTHLHFPHLLAFWDSGRKNDGWFCCWLSATSGLAGKGNYNRSLYSANSGLACGMKGYFWFLGGDLMNPKSLEWTQIGRDLIKVNQEICPLRKVMAEVGLPTQILSTPITKTLNNGPLPDSKKEMMPPGLEKHGFPKDFWIEPKSGEFVMGMFNDKEKRDLVFLANHHAYAEQKVVLRLARHRSAELFNRKTGAWGSLKVDDSSISFHLEAGGGELLRFAKG